MTLPKGVATRTFDGERSLATRGSPVFDEPTADEWRRWDPRRSKVAAMLSLGMDIGLTGGESVLYLGAGAGTTVSHLADVVGPLYAVEFAARPMRRLLSVAEARSNVYPLLKDARKPDAYAHVVESDVDLLVQDVATRGQAAVAVANRRFLANDGRLLMAVKARSEDVTRDPETVFESVLDELDGAYKVLESRPLRRYHADHLAVVARPRER